MQQESDRFRTAKFGSVAEQYNGRDGGRHFKWYSKQMFLYFLRQVGASEASCTERQCMDALAATSLFIRNNPEKSAHLVPFAGPQCFAHLNPAGSCYRVDANHRRQPGKIDEPTALDALHPDRWKQCCSCGKWRFVDEDTARLLRTESFFDRRDTDLDWGRWLRDAKKRYDHFATCHSSSGGGDDSAVHGDAGSHEQGTLDGACDDERVTSEEGSGES